MNHQCYTSTIAIIIGFIYRNKTSMTLTLLCNFSCRIHATFKISTARWVLHSASTQSSVVPWLNDGWRKCCSIRGRGLGLGHSPILWPLLLKHVFACPTSEVGLWQYGFFLAAVKKHYMLGEKKNYCFKPKDTATRVVWLRKRVAVSCQADNKCTE